MKASSPSASIFAPRALTFHGIYETILKDASREILIEGARMCAKTYTACAKVWYSCIDNPGIWWLICRYSGTETDNQLRPIFSDICRRMGVAPKWDNDESCYVFPEVDGLVSKVFAYGLKSQSKDERFAKVRGSGVAGLFNDQHEETPEDISTEMRALIRQPGYPHQLILAANPFPEDSYLADQFPEDRDLEGRKRYELSLYDNAKNLDPKDIESLERTFPITHAKYKSLILGKRGTNATGIAVYRGMFDRATHFVPCLYEDSRPVLEAFQYGQHHPTWLASQRTYRGGLRVLGAVMGKFMMLEDFLDRVSIYRKEWFPDAVFKTCADPPPQIGTFRYTNLDSLRRAGYRPVHRENGNAADVQEAMIQSLAALMHRRKGSEGFSLSDDPSRFVMISKDITKLHKFVIDGLEAEYVWDPNYVSVGNKKTRHPKESEWVNGAQRCLENIWLNFCADTPSDYEKDRADESDRVESDHEEVVSPWG